MSHHIDPTALLGVGVTIGHNVVVGAGAIIGDRCHLGHGSIIEAQTVLGDETYVNCNAVLGRMPRGVGSMSRPPRTDLVALRLGRQCVIGAGAVLYRGSQFGDACLLGDLACVREECEVGSRVIIGRAVTVNYQTRIHDRVKIMDNTHITGNMIIEQGVFISVLVSTTNDNSLDRVHDSAVEMKGPHLRTGSAVGAGANLLPGVTVGEYAVVAAHSLVNADVPPRVIVAGMPARVVKAVPDEWLPKNA